MQQAVSKIGVAYEKFWRLFYEIKEPSYCFYFLYPFFGIPLTYKHVHSPSQKIWVTHCFPFEKLAEVLTLRTHIHWYLPPLTDHWSLWLLEVGMRLIVCRTAYPQEKALKERKSRDPTVPCWQNTSTLLITY